MLSFVHCLTQYSSTYITYVTVSQMAMTSCPWSVLHKLWNICSSYSHLRGINGCHLHWINPSTFSIKKGLDERGVFHKSIRNRGASEIRGKGSVDQVFWTAINWKRQARRSTASPRKLAHHHHYVVREGHQETYHSTLTQERYVWFTGSNLIGYLIFITW